MQETAIVSGGYVPLSSQNGPVGISCNVPPPPKQRWASTLANISNARHRSNTRLKVERNERSNFFEKLKSKIVPCTSTFPKVEGSKH